MTLTPKLDKDISRKLQINAFHEHYPKTIIKILAKSKSNICKRIIFYDQGAFIPGMQG